MNFLKLDVNGSRNEILKMVIILGRGNNMFLLCYFYMWELRLLYGWYYFKLRKFYFKYFICFKIKIRM